MGLYDEHVEFKSFRSSLERSARYRKHMRVMKGLPLSPTAAGAGVAPEQLSLRRPGITAGAPRTHCSAPETGAKPELAKVEVATPGSMFPAMVPNLGRSKSDASSVGSRTKPSQSQAPPAKLTAAPGSAPPEGRRGSLLKAMQLFGRFK